MRAAFPDGATCAEKEPTTIDVHPAHATRRLPTRLVERGLGLVRAAVAAAATRVRSRDGTGAARAHLDRRLPVIRAHLAEAQPGFVFLAGNSHAECVGDALARRMPLVNGGIGGISAPGYAAQLDALPFRARAGVAVLFLGTNDIVRGAAPLSERTEAKFRAAILRVLRWLRANADVVLVAAVPPLGPAATAVRDPEAVTAYNGALRELCAAADCRFFDPFAALRDAGHGRTTLACPDGVHLADYDVLAAELVPRLRRGAIEPPA